MIIRSDLLSSNRVIFFVFIMCFPLIATARIPLIIDTDMAGDDWLAILFLLSQPDVDIKAITVSGTGQAYPEPAGNNVLKLLDLANAPDIPVATGTKQSISGQNTFPKSVREAASTLQGIALPESNRVAHQSKVAAELIIQILNSSEEPVTILAIGTWTNLAHALQKDPSIVRKIDRIVAMGGAVNVPGNIHKQPDNKLPNKAAEWNFYMDPKSVHFVMVHNISIDLVPLDATSHVPASDALVGTLRARGDSKVLSFAAQTIDGWRKDGCHTLSMWDPLAAVALVHPEIVKFDSAVLNIDTDRNSETEGALYTDSLEGRPVRFAVSAQKSNFEALFVDGLTKLPH